MLGKTKFQLREFLLSGSKAMSVERRRKKKRAKVGDDNGQATHGARKHAWRTQATWAKNLSNSFTSNGSFAGIVFTDLFLLIFLIFFDLHCFPPLSSLKLVISDIYVNKN